ncbi:hypothetical protein OQJ15_11365 [Fluoribacter dumoffii]|uniref:Ubiquinone biosynthesis hydroxylase, UbiH/UbiF/VisC/COQ6 family n=1 Tax=Fluoribacter dumoffii TaxID=463 RepID=A0A377G6Q3_9GAMM|nr:hypothetical protein [Fluoribacter dumoffii]KTC89335.1 hypothetical protein Ldum_0403 [Fluoribacter dumoffii NY 23]MCW8386906.1 hypothetical protein [Fluoribacter dumoffii]MCW8497108.1 hypothetical protein [Fluoribacter dumoffii]STO20444.1 ubiquinone biosynthesis hydroxylase, UbiH/UbiF/VisC/COQ6 family [Fluoribacter dumoffii]
MYTDPNANPSAPYDLLIVGMGPVGLAAAYETAKKNKNKDNKNKVLIIEKRSESTAAIRPQVIVLEPSRKAQLMDMIGQGESLDERDIAFLDSLSTSAEIKLSTVQRFILNRIKNQSQTGDIGPVEILYETTLKEGVNLGEGEASIITRGQEKQIRFTHLVGADGASSSTLDLVNPSLDEPERIERTTPSDMQHLEKTFHLGAYVKISLKNGQELALPEKEFVSSFLENENDAQVTESQLYFLRFDKSSHEKSQKKSVKLGFIGEIPKEIFDKIQGLNQQISLLDKRIKKLRETISPDRASENSLANLEVQLARTKNQKQNLVLSYVRRSAADYLGINENELAVTITASKTRAEKNNLKILTFQGGSKQANKAATQANGHAFYLIGDAYFTPNYPVGHGLNNGLESAKLLGEVPTGGSSDLPAHMAQYDSLCSKNAAFARLVMQGVRRFRKLDIGRNFVAELLENAVEKREKGDKVDLKKNLSHTIFADAAKPEDSIEIFLKDKFNISHISSLVEKGNLNYDIGFISADCPELKGKSEPEKLQFLQKLSEQNNGIPILIKSLDAENAPKYSLYRFNKEYSQNEAVDILNERLAKGLDNLLERHKVAFTNELNIINNKTVTQDLITKIFSSTVNNADIPLHFLPADNEIEQKIQEWGRFLTKNPSIVKQYRVEISEQLKAIQEVFSNYKNESVNLKFKGLYERFNSIVEKHNNELITLAKKGPNKWDASGRSPLYHVLQYGDLDTIKTILGFGANPNKACKYSCETIFTRRVLEKPEIARVLLVHGANPFNDAKSSYFIASFLGDRQSPYFCPKFGVECLLALADPNCKIKKSDVTKIAESQIVQLKKTLQDKALYELYLDKPYLRTAVARIAELKNIPAPEDQDAQIDLVKEFVDESLDKILKAKKAIFSKNSFFPSPKDTGRAETTPEIVLSEQTLKG